MSQSCERYDVLIVGGGPAGLSAALVLVRSRRQVLVLDAGISRNAASLGMHGFLSRDGMPPLEFIRLAKAEVQGYGVEIREATVVGASIEGPCFSVELSTGESIGGRKILFATGVVDKLPKIPDLKKYYGKSIHHCPYCDGWEHRDGRIAVYGNGKGVGGLAVKMKGWAADIVVCTGGPSRIPEDARERLSRYDIPVYEKKILRLEGTPPKLARIVFEDGSGIDRSAIFFSTGNAQRSELVGRIGCDISGKGAVMIDRKQRTSVPGVFVCGDAAHDSQYVIIAAAHGARAAMAIDNDLHGEDYP